MWSGGEFGKAAVMVGSGFSRNADKISATSPDFPLWWDLEEKMRNELSSSIISANLDALEWFFLNLIAIIQIEQLKELKLLKSQKSLDFGSS